MSSRTHHFRIGLFVLIGAFLFIGALFAMGLRSYFGQFDIYETSVPGKVDSLSPGALVKLRGVTIGKVSTIDFVKSEQPEYHEQSVLVHFEVPKNTVWSGEGSGIQEVLDKEIASGLRARVQAQGFLGASILSLEYVDPTMYPVEPVPWTPKHYYIPSAPSQFNRVLTSLEKTLRETDDLDLRDVFSKAEVLITGANRLVTNANYLVGNVDHLVDHVNDVDFKQIGTNANSLIVEFRETNRRLQTALNGVDLPTIGHDTAALEIKLTTDAEQLQQVLKGVDMADLNGALANVRNATDEMVVLLHKLQQRPSSVIFSKPPEPVPELEKPPKK